MIGTIRVIVVGVAHMHEPDPEAAGRGADPVLAPAVALAERLGATLHVVRAFERSDPVLGSYIADLEHGTALRNRQAALERCRWAQDRGRASGARVHCHAVEGRADLQLCAFADEVEADLLIVGATRRGRLPQKLLGSTAQRVLQHASRPVLVVRRPFDRPLRRVLLTTDLSELSPALHEAALDTVDEVFGSGPLDVRTLLVCRYDRVTAARMSRGFMTQAATSRLRQFLAERQHRSWPVLGAVRLGNPSTEIVHEAAAWNADLLVLGSHGPPSAHRRLLGSTAAATLRSFRGNALVIPASVTANWQPRAETNRSGNRTEPSFPGTEEHAEPGRVLVGS